MRLGSLFDGIGGWMLAGVRCGITPVWASEIEPFPIEVTKRHFPWVKHLGDIKEINGAGIEPVEVIAFGSPCQGLSVAGGRGGLSDERSGLFLEAIRIIREMREATNGRYPRIIVWENVPGAFRTNQRNDFRIVLEKIAETAISVPASGKWADAGMVRSNSCEVAWRVLDAQYWGVPQRRKRIFLVADFGGRSATEILFKPESLRWNFAASGEARQRTARNATGGIGESSLGFDTRDSIANSMPVLADKTPPIKTNNRLGVMAFKQGQGAKAGGLGLAVNISPTLTSVSSGTNMVPVVYTSQSFSEYKDCCIASTLRSRGSKDATDLVVALDCRNICTNEVSATLQAKNLGGYSLNYQNPVYVDQKVRRLMPIECERLQGLPDGWTDGGSDTARYKAIGNGMAQCCADYVMFGIADVLKGVD